MVSLRPLKLTLLLGLVCTAAATPAGAAVKWRTDLNSAVGESRRTGKPMLVDFYTDWCGWCKRLDRDVYPDPSVARLSKQFVMVKLNAEGNGAAAAQQAGVTGFPTLLFLDARGNRLLTIPGYVPAPTLSQAMQRVLDSQPKKPKEPNSGAAAGSGKPGVVRGAPAGNTYGNSGKSAKNGQWQGASGVYLLDETGAVRLDSKATPPANSAAPSRPTLSYPSNGKGAARPSHQGASSQPGSAAAAPPPAGVPETAATPAPLSPGASGLTISPTGVLTHR